MVNNDEEFDADEILRDPHEEETGEKVLDVDEDGENIEEIDFSLGHAALLDEQQDLFEEN